ncbi:MAG TPA: T9SS type A sorting domain-containing protein, partial [Saprospiraceae bacterium]|nr:T9SS type A sorting domain-containing protein [Saprospiraceae bacterium]
ARLLSDKDCEMGQTDLRAQSEGAWAALYAAFDQSASSGAEPDLSVAIALFDPVADFDSAQLVSAGAVCKQYVDVAQVFVAPDAAGQQRAEGRGTSAAWAGAQAPSLSISPNPSAGIFTVSLSDSPCTLRVWDALGRLVHEASGVSGLTVVDASGWAAGLYVVEVNGAEGKSWGKVVVEH